MKKKLEEEVSDSYNEFSKKMSNFGKKKFFHKRKEKFWMSKNIFSFLTNFGISNFFY